VHQPPDQLRAAGEVDELVLTRPPGDHRAWHPVRRAAAVLVVIVAPGWRYRVDEDLDLATDPRPVPLQPDPLLQREQLVEPAPLHVGPDVVGEAGRGRPRP